SVNICAPHLARWLHVAPSILQRATCNLHVLTRAGGRRHIRARSGHPRRTPSWSRVWCLPERGIPRSSGAAGAADGHRAAHRGGGGMATAAVPYGRSTQVPSAVSDVHVVWITTGLGCDGDSVSVTAATQPSIEDVLLGAIPGLPTVHLHNPVLAYEVGDDFMKFFYQAERGELDPFVLVFEGSVPNE